MSLNELNLDLQKPWLNARVQNLTVDGSTTVANIVTGEVEADSIKFPDPSTILNFYRFQPSVTVNVLGTFLIAPQTVQARISQIGTIAAIEIPTISIQTANQNASGTIELELETQINYTGSQLFVGDDGTRLVCRANFLAGRAILHRGLAAAPWTMTGAAVNLLDFTFVVVQ